MVDFGILSAIRQLICSERIGDDYGLLPSSIYVMKPDIAPKKWPAVFLELEESWSTGCMPGMGSVALKISVLSNSKDGAEALDIANQIRQLIDGSSIEVETCYEATFRMNSSIVDMKKVALAPRKVEQYYEAFVHIVGTKDVNGSINE
ncbi:MAG: hypothetical protein LBQ43_05100 [Holosporales bacterium]|jgi:hypothetical protein|nr:hypothetical protein [Holosporales bacterium]